jgi:S-adenosylmethionine hydrolase
LSKIITLTTDFGTKDGYAGAVKGVILSLNPEVQIVEISPEVPAADILAGAFCLYNACQFYPENTIHLAVVDPGVGGFRKPVLIKTERHIYLGPDNGIFDLMVRTERVKKIIHLTNSNYFLRELSATFHGRDVFAPVAAYLSLGVKPDEFGVQIKKINKLSFPLLTKSAKKIVGEIIHIDNFGNLVSNVTRSELKQAKESKIKIKNRVIPKISTTFSDVKSGEIVAYLGSSNFLEVGVNLGNAARTLRAKVGDKIEIQL